MKLRNGLKVLVGLSAGLFAVVASANVITFFGDWLPQPAGPQITYVSDDDRSQLTCSLGCTALLSSLASGIYAADVPNVSTAAGFSALNGDLFWLANNSLASETAFVNAAVVGPDFATGTKTDGGGAENISFTSSATYILLKIGADPNIALIYNPSGLEQTYTYLAFEREGAGLSHYTTFGSQEIPVPEPGSLALLGLGLVGLAAARRRRAIER